MDTETKRIMRKPYLEPVMVNVSNIGHDDLALRNCFMLVCWLVVFLLIINQLRRRVLPRYPFPTQQDRDRRVLPRYPFPTQQDRDAVLMAAHRKISRKSNEGGGHGIGSPPILMAAHRKISRKSNEGGGHGIGSPPIHRCGNDQFKWLRIFTPKWSSAPSCWNHILRLTFGGGSSYKPG
ncbi:hypothetical protein QE152_g17980 [Popillia japonica]|uniref:Uncharacterized protein n=1 Tax=Popillia japonica TaxID=7064 RepID=A0AAW1L4T7_POPJA